MFSSLRSLPFAYVSSLTDIVVWFAEDAHAAHLSEAEAVLERVRQTRAWEKFKGLKELPEPAPESSRRAGFGMSQASTSGHQESRV
eukprot:scaffold40279_cov28-Prasinocladus_malaysianus.AAC.2